MDTYIYGGDSETHRGEPMTFQFHSREARVSELIYVTPQNATAKFFAFLGTLRAKCNHVIYVHNLEFDAPEFLWAKRELLVVNTGGEFEFTYGSWKVTGVYGHPTFIKCKHETRKLSVLIVDSFAWYAGALAKAAELFCPELPKLQRPKDLGQRLFKRGESRFEAYAMRDAEISYAIGVVVQKMHAEYDIRQAVSLADMSAKIFRHHFLSYTIPQPGRDVIISALKSYHGGKNFVLKGAAPRWHTGITSMDISSAYPYAMSELPAFSNKKLYKRLALRSGTRMRQVEPFGVYCVSGEVQPYTYPVLFSHAFEPLPAARIQGIHICGLELNRALELGAFKLHSLRGTYYDAERDRTEPALRSFCAHFYEKKETERDPVLRHMYKILLNALYGKFIQTRKKSAVLYTEIGPQTAQTSVATEVVAGGMFHPFIATQITAHTRVYINEVEESTKAFHTATDGVFTYSKKVPRLPGRPRSGLGSLKIEARGDLALVRGKCYILYGAEGKTPSEYFKSKRIVKYAKHGFMGTVYDLEKYLAHGAREYKASRPNRLRESVKRGLAVNDFVERPYVLKVGEMGIYDKPSKIR